MTKLYELEEAIMSAWSLTETLKDIVAIAEAKPEQVSKENLLDTIKAMQVISNLKFEVLFAAYEAALKDQVVAKVNEITAGVDLELNATEADNGGWIKWEGGNCPVGLDAEVDVKFRNGWTDYSGKAYNWEWHHYGFGGDIAYYRISK